MTQQQNNQKKERYHARLAEGLCTVCGSEADINPKKNKPYIQCAKCRESTNDRQKGYRREGYA